MSTPSLVIVLSALLLAPAAKAAAPEVAEPIVVPITADSIWYGRGLSMTPAIRDGQPCRPISKPYSTLKAGEIGCYRSARWHCIVAHRLVRKTLLHTGWLVQGDSNPKGDIERLTPENYVCVIVALPFPGHEGRPIARLAAHN